MAPIARPVSTPASRGARFAAFLVDLFLPFLVCLAVQVALRANLDDPRAYFRIEIAGIFGLVALSLVQVILLSVRGQSLGKMALGIRIVRLADGRNPGFWQAVVCRELLPWLLTLIPVVGLIYVLVDRLCIFSDDRRCLRDHLAETEVVEA